jgi:hypothetical protein
MIPASTSPFSKNIPTKPIDNIPNIQPATLAMPNPYIFHNVAKVHIKAALILKQASAIQSLF